MKPMLTARFEEALFLAAPLHAKQVRKGTEIPYVAHLLIVAGTVLKIAALRTKRSLPCCTMPSRIKAAHLRMSESKRSLVRMSQILRKDAAIQMRPQSPPWKERKVKYLTHLRSASPLRAIGFRC